MSAIHVYIKKKNMHVSHTRVYKKKKNMHVSHTHVKIKLYKTIIILIINIIDPDLR